MSEKDNAQGNELFEQAMKNYEQALQAGLKLQQESAKWWMDLVNQAGSPEDWQSKVKELATETVPITQKRMEENLKILEQSSRTSLDLLSRAMDAVKADSPSAGQAKMQEMWETSLEAVRTNAAAINQANAKWVESWMQFMPKSESTPGAKETSG